MQELTFFIHRTKKSTRIRRYVATLNVERTVDAACCCVAWVKVVLVELKYVVMCVLQLPWILGSTFYNLGHVYALNVASQSEMYLMTLKKK